MTYKHGITTLALAMLASLFTGGIAGIITFLASPELVPGTSSVEFSAVQIFVSFVTIAASFPVFAYILFTLKEVNDARSTLENTVRRDGLTGLLSREAFLTDVRQDLSEVDEEQPIDEAFLIVDADFFKKINDQHGHIAGDRALIAITKALKKGIRATDRIGRLGGEEFAVQLRSVDRERALEIAERLRKNVMEASTQVDIPDLELSVSIGAVTYNSKRDLVDLLVAADKLLYRAKDNGRNRVEHETIDDMPLAA